MSTGNLSDEQKIAMYSAIGCFVHEFRLESIDDAWEWLRARSGRPTARPQARI